MSAKWPAAATKLIEDKANGPAVIQELQHDVAGLIAINPEGGKIARAQAVSPQCESGNVYLPHPAIAPWVDALIEEFAQFPNGHHDDQVDSMSQALNRLRKSRALDAAFFRAVMEMNLGNTKSSDDGGSMDILPSEYPMGGPDRSWWRN
jgi:phage terminase large subunit-like protein